VPGPPLRCLLLSPVAPPDPRNGDSQFTADLVREPPPGVEYVPYTEALASGEIEWGPSLRRPGTLRAPRDPLFAAARAGLHVLRRTGVLLPDPVRWLRVLGRFDLVHVHCMPVRFLSSAPPVVASDSAGTWWYWTAGRGMPERRVDILLRRERRAASALGYLHPTVRSETAARLLLFVESGRPLVERYGFPAPTLWCPPGVPAAERKADGDGRTLLFVARDFEAKGGPVALEALRLVRERRPETRLLVAGPETGDPGLEGVEWLGPKSRDELYRDVYPRADLFLYPTRADCAPLVVMEALAHGLPVVAPNAFALPELVQDGVTGLLFEPEDAAGAAAAVERVLGERDRMSPAARDDFERRFSVARRNEILAVAYAEAAA